MASDCFLAKKQMWEKACGLNDDFGKNEFFLKIVFGYLACLWYLTVVYYQIAI